MKYSHMFHKNRLTLECMYYGIEVAADTVSHGLVVDLDIRMLYSDVQDPVHGHFASRAGTRPPLG